MSAQPTNNLPAPAEFAERLCDLLAPLDDDVRCESDEIARRLEAADNGRSEITADDLQAAHQHLAYVEQLATWAAYVTAARTITGSDYGRLHVQAQMRAIIHTLCGYERLALTVTAYERWAPVTAASAS